MVTNAWYWSQVHVEGLRITGHGDTQIEARLLCHAKGAILAPIHWLVHNNLASSSHQSEFAMKQVGSEMPDSQTAILIALLCTLPLLLHDCSSEYS